MPKPVKRLNTNMPYINEPIILPRKTDPHVHDDSSEEWANAREEHPSSAGVYDIANSGNVDDPIQSLIDYLRLRVKQDGSNDDQLDSYIAMLIQLQQSELQFKRSLPEEQIQHLMATGMSRSAAMAKLQGSEYTPSNMQIAGNSEETKLAKKQFGLQTASEVISMLGQIAQCGLQIGATIPSIKHTMAATQALNLQNEQGKLYANAQMAVGKYLQAFDNYKTYSQSELPSNLTDTIAAVQDSPFAESVTSWSEDMSNPYFYPAIRKAFREQVMDSYELANDLQVMRDLQKLRDADINQKTAEAWQAMSELQVQWETQRDQIEMSHNNLAISNSQKNIAASQESMARDEAYMSRLDRNFWTPEKRAEYLKNHTDMEYYQMRLAGLGVEYQEKFNEVAFEELNQKLALYAELGPDFVKQQADNLMQNEQYRSCVLQLSNMQVNRQIQQRQNISEYDKNAPIGSDQWFAAKFASISDFFNAYKSSGLIDSAIKFASLAAKK